MFDASTTQGQFCLAIAFAEGCIHRDGSYNTYLLPYRLNNPGDLKITNSHYTHWMDVSGKLKFVDIGTGWNALAFQVDLMFTNKSSVYNNSMSIQEVANHYAKEHSTVHDQTNADNWAKNVALFLGVDVNTKLKELDKSNQETPDEEVIQEQANEANSEQQTQATDKWGKVVSQ